MKALKVSKKKGFSLVELLVVIAVIGVIAAIAIPALGGIFGQSREAKNRRNAQSICSIFSAASNAGVTFTTDLSTDAANGTAEAATAAKGIVATLRVPQAGTGVNAASTFHLDLDDGDVEAAAAYYSVKNGLLVYTAGGDGVATP